MPAPSTNPFPGLRPFESHENHLFFGRDGQSDDLLQRLSRQRFIAVVGTSGSGKSSLVRAGLLPALHGGFMLRAGSNWRVAILRPGSNPIGRLSQALCQDGVLGSASVDEGIQLSMTEAALRRSALGLIDVVRQAPLNPQDNLLVVVDQFEELFRVKAKPGSSKPDDAAAFVKLLLEATRQSELPIYVLLTMRSDFLGDCSQFRDLPEVINDSQYLIPRMTRDQRREAIVGPVAVGGAQIATRLVNRLLNDAGDNPDQLPVLQHALMRMWQQWEKAGDESVALDLSHYEAIGGLAGAMSRHADEAYDELKTEHDRRIAEIVFKLLTERGGDNRESRRPTRLSEICAIAEVEESEVLAVIEGFRREDRSFLMPPLGTTLRPNTFIDISHESLIRGWQRLQRWVDDEALSARIYRRLAETATLHRAGEAGLWRDPDLAIALAWRDKNRPNAAWGERYSPDFEAAMSFLEKSRRARDAEHFERDRMRRRNLRLVTALALVCLVGLCISSALGGVAYYQYKRAATRTVQAEESARQAKASEQRAMAAEVNVRNERDRAKEAEGVAQSERDRARQSAQLAEQKTQEATRSLKAAQLAKAAEAIKALALVVATKQAEDAKLDAIIGKEKAEVFESQAYDLSSRLYDLSLRARRSNIDSNAWRLRIAQRLEQISPKGERAYWQTQEGDAWAALGDSERALRIYTAVLRDDPNNLGVLSARGAQYLTNKDAANALRDIEKSLKMENKAPYLYINMSIGQSYLGKYDDALQTMKECIAIFTHLGSAEYRERDVAKEIEDITRQKELHADSDATLTAFYYDIANLAAANGGENFAASVSAADARPESRDAYDAYLYALNLSLLNSQVRPGDYGALVAQGVLWRRAGYCGRAEIAFDEFTTKHQSQHEPRYDGLATWLAANRQAEKDRPGIRCRNESRVAVLDKTARDYLLDGLQNVWAGRNAEAEAALTIAIELGGNDPDFLIERMKLRFFNQGNFAGAKEDAEAVIKNTKGNAVAYLVRGMAKAQLNSADVTIIDDIREARKLNPSVYTTISDIGAGYGKQLVDVLAKTDREDAMDLLRRAIAYDVPSSYPHYMLARLLSDKGSFPEALVQINIAIALDRTRLDYFPEKLRAIAGLRGRLANGAKAEPPDPADVPRTKLDYYSSAGDAFAQNGQSAEALGVYGESLKALNEIAGLAKNKADLSCEVATIVAKLSNVLQKEGAQKTELVDYFDKVFSGLKEIYPLIEAELKK